MRELGIRHRIIQTKPYKLINGKKTKTYGLVGLNALFRQGRSLSLPTLPYQQTNRYAVVGATFLTCTWVIMICFLCLTHANT